MHLSTLIPVLICLSICLLTCTEIHRVHAQNLITKFDQMETLWWTIFSLFLKQPQVDMFMNKSRDDYHTYRHPLRVFSLIWYQPSKATHQQSQSKRLKTLSSHYALVSPRISRARMRSGLQDSEFLDLALSVTCQIKPILSTLLSDVWGEEYGSQEPVLDIEGCL